MDLTITLHIDFYHEYTIISCIKLDFDVKHFMCEAYCRLCSWLLMWEAASIHLDVPSPLVSGVNKNTLIVVRNGTDVPLISCHDSSAEQRKKRGEELCANGLLPRRVFIPEKDEIREVQEGPVFKVCACVHAAILATMIAITAQIQYQASQHKRVVIILERSGHGDRTQTKQAFEKLQYWQY